MNDRTLRKILGDPQFNPDDILGPALSDFINLHPEEIAKDKVAIKYLAEDPEVVHLVMDVIDWQDFNMVEKILGAIAQMRWQKADVVNKAFTKMTHANHENLPKVFSTIKKHVASLSLLPNSLGELPKIFSPEQISELIDEMSANPATWGPKDWAVAVRSKECIEAFLARLAANTVNLVMGCDEDFQTISVAAEHIKRLNLGDYSVKLINFCKNKWKSYVCFKCGKGCGKNFHGKLIESHLIKSISGYTLHRKKCAPNGEFKSPWEIFFGMPRELQFNCDRCGQPFTTTSGLTLHSKSCCGGIR
jgi:hypothetical protein